MVVVVGSGGGSGGSGAKGTVGVSAEGMGRWSLEQINT